MAISARSVEEAEAAACADWHIAYTTEVRASDLWQGQRRMEAEAYLHEGYRIKASIERRVGGWQRLGDVASASAPPRIKQILVSAAHGVPYLNTSQVFDLRPVPRKWLAMSKTSSGSARLVEEGTILLMASATVGRAILATKAHEGSIVSHHFMRVVPKAACDNGWLYGYLRSNAARAMMDATQYASVIRHIEPHHLHELPVPNVSPALAESFAAKAIMITRLRNSSADALRRADRVYASAVDPREKNNAAISFSVPVSALSAGRRRFEADFHAPEARDIIECLPAATPLGELCDGIWWGKRFKRNYGASGVPYLSADDLFTTNRYYGQNILLPADSDYSGYTVKAGWLLMACSGQTYGLNGAVTISRPEHENCFFSHDLIRIVPKASIRAGYLLVALSHPTLGRPIVIRQAYGMSIPHLDPEDVATTPIARLGDAIENEIADLAERSVRELGEAEALEQEIAADAQAVVEELLAGRSD